MRVFCFVLFVFLIFFENVAVLRADDEVPLLPHPAERSPYLDESRQESPQEERKNLDEVSLPQFSQDKYSNEEPEKNYSEELRKYPELRHEESEVEIAKGIVALNAGKKDEAQKRFLLAIKKDSRNFLAMEYIAAVFERRQDSYEALKWLVKAKHSAPKSRYGVLNYHVGRLYFLLKNEARAEAYLRLAADQDGHKTAAFYLLGYIFMRQRRYFDAQAVFHEAWLRAKRADASLADRSLLQAIYYYLGECDARIGFDRLAARNLVGAEVGDSFEVRTAAWKLYSDLNHPRWNLSVAVLAQHDSNVILLPPTATLPVEYSSQSAFSSVLAARGGWQSSPVAKWAFDVNGGLYLNMHLNETLGEFDIFQFSLNAGGTYMSLKEWSSSLRYELRRAMNNRNEFSTYQTNHGPVLTVDFSPNQKWVWQVGGRFSFDSYATDLSSGPDRRSGVGFDGFFQLSLKAPNPRLRPTVRYDYEAGFSQGENYVSRSHVILAEIDYRLFEAWHFGSGIRYSLVSFPDHLIGRGDKLAEFHLGATYLFSRNWNLISNINYMKNESSLSRFSYTRTTVSTGVAYTF